MENERYSIKRNLVKYTFVSAESLNVGNCDGQMEIVDVLEILPQNASWE